MKTLVVLASLPLFLLCSCTVTDYPTDGSGTTVVVDSRVGNGVAVTETRSLPAITRIDVQAPIHVTVKTGNQYDAYVTADDNLTGYILTSADYGTLTIQLAADIQPSVTPEVVVVIPDLQSVIQDGSGTVDVQEDGNFPDLTLQLNGSGVLNFSGTATTLHAVLNGYGRMNLDGYAASLQADLPGEGDISAENLLVGDASVNLDGTGNVFLDLDYQSTLDLNLSGSGRVEWWGAPAHLNYVLTGSGKVVEHNGLPKRAAAAKRGAGTGYAADLKGGSYTTREVLPPKR